MRLAHAINKASSFSKLILHVLTATHSDEDYSKGFMRFCLELKSLEIHLLTALKEVCMYNLDCDFDELLRDVEIENPSNTAICAVEAPTTHEIVLDACTCIVGGK